VNKWDSRDPEDSAGSEPHYLSIGEVVRPHGVRGELRVRILTEYPERLNIHTHFYLAHPAFTEKVYRYAVERMRLRRDVLLLKLEGCDDRTAAEALRGMLVQIPLEDAVPLEEGEYYLFQLLGVDVETEQGEWLGRIVEVLETGANDVYVVRGPRGEVLVPAIGEVVRSLDLAAKRMVIHLMPGLLGDEEDDQ